MAASREIAVQFFFAHDSLDAIDGIERSGIHFAHGFAAVTPNQRRHRQLHTGEHHAAVAGTGAPAESFGFQHGNVHAAFRECSRSGKAAVTPANYCDVSAVRQFLRRFDRRRDDSLEPVVFFFDRHEERQEAHEILASPGPGRKTAKRNSASEEKKGSDKSTMERNVFLDDEKWKRRQSVT